MEDNKWKAYEEKVNEIKQHFKKEKRKGWLIFLAYNVVVDVVLFFVRNLLTTPFAITVFLVSTLLSLYILLKNITQLNRVRNEQLLLHQQNEPTGRFRV